VTITADGTLKLIVPTVKKPVQATHNTIDSQLVGYLLTFGELQTRLQGDIHSQAGVATTTLRESLPLQYRTLAPAVGTTYIKYAMDKTATGWFTHLQACCRILPHKLTPQEILDLFAALIINSPAEGVDVTNLHQLQSKTSMAAVVASYAKERAAAEKKEEDELAREEARIAKSSRYDNSRRDNRYDNSRRDNR
jgi:hypothetical protein